MANIDVLPGLGGHVYADKQLVVVRTTTPNGLTFAGEIDASNSQAVDAAIASAQVPDRDIHIEVGSLLFATSAASEPSCRPRKACPRVADCSFMGCRRSSKP